MVTRLQCGSIIMTYMRNGEIYKNYSIANASDHIAATKRHFLGLPGYLQSKLAWPSCHDFWNKWSGSICIVPLWLMTYMIKDEINILYPHKMHLITFPLRNFTFKVFQDIFRVNLHMQDPAATILEINGHEVSVWFHYDDLHAKWWNIQKLLHIKCIWSHCRYKTSLF